MWPSCTEIFVVKDIANHLQHWKLRTILKQEIHEASIFNIRKNYSIKTTEGTILLHKKHEPKPQSITWSTIHIWTWTKVWIFSNRNSPGSCQSTQHDDIGSTSILLCLRHKRILDFNVFLLSVLQSILADGHVHFNYYPNLKVSLQDKNIVDVLKLVRYILQSRNSRSFFSICVYVQSSLQMHACPTNSAAKKSSLIYRTLFYQTIIRSPSSVASRTINLVSITIWWSDVQLPEEWK